MGTAKRERQKANRAQKAQETARQQRVDSVRRTGTRVGIGIVVAVVAVLLIAWIGGAFSGDDDGDEQVATDDAAGTSVAATETECPPVDGVDAPVRDFDAPPPTCIETDGSVTYLAEVTTNLGPLTIELDVDRAPNTVNNFVVLSRYDYYDDTPCHRIIPGFVAQCGDPAGTGTGGPGYRFADELPEAGEYEIGSVAMANSGPDTNGSQFFIITGEQGANLPPNFSLFGTVVEGLDDTVAALDAVGNPDNDGVPPLEPVTIESIDIVER